jgi:hypothetical protein
VSHNELLIWRPLHHIEWKEWRDGSRVRTYCGLDVPFPAAEYLAATAPDINWTHHDLCRKCRAAYREANPDESPEPSPAPEVAS